MNQGEISSSKFKLVNVEALRGFAALMVFMCHSMIYSRVVDRGYDFRANNFSYAPSGHLMVLVFFVLSGFVIGWTYRNTEGFSSADYLTKRLLRLYPIYVIAVLVAIFLFAEKPRAVFATLFFGQNLWGPNLKQNAPLWSLNHEMIYYVLAIPILQYRTKIVGIFTFIGILLFISTSLFAFYPIIEGYLVGFSFWLAGFGLSRFRNTEPVNTFELLSILLLLLSCDYLNFANILVGRLAPLHHASIMDLDSIVQVKDLSFLPYCLLAVCTAAGIKKKFTYWLAAILFGNSLLHLAYLVYSGALFKTSIFLIPTVLLLISVLLYLLPKKKSFPLRLLPCFGSVSYGFYLLHAPIQKLIGRISYFSGSLSTFIFRLVVSLVVCFMIAYFLERVYQPFIKKNCVSFFQKLTQALMLFRRIK